MKTTNQEITHALCECNGNVSQTARLLGISRSTLRGRLESIKANPNEVNARAKELQVVTDAKTIRELTGKVELLQEQLKQSRAPVVPVPVTRTQRQNIRVRVVFPDVHGNHMDRKAVGAFLGDLQLLKPQEVIGLGDLLECGGWLAQHHTPGHVAETDQMSFEQDVAAGNDFLDKVQKVCGNVSLLEGNHEARIEKWIVTNTLRHGGDAEWLRNQIGPEKVLNIKKRKIKYYRSDLQHDGLEYRGVIKRGKCLFTHGYSTAKHAAWQHLVRAGGNIVYGHTHRADYSIGRTIANGMGAAWSPGCLSQLQPLWKHTAPTDWTHGYLIQCINKDGNFQTILVPIYKGVSMLGQCVQLFAK